MSTTCYTPCMDITAAKRLAERLMRELGVEGYRVVIDARPTRRLGQCRYSQRCIGLSRKPIEAQTDDDIVEQVIRHELAHAAVGPGHGHDAVWRRQARAFGVRKPRSRLDNAVAVEGPVKVVCERCGVVGSMMRMPKRTFGKYHLTCRQPVRFERRG